MRGFARRLDDEPPEVEPDGQLSCRYPAFQQRGDARLEIREKILKYTL